MNRNIARYFLFGSMLVFFPIPIFLFVAAGISTVGLVLVMIISNPWIAPILLAHCAVFGSIFFFLSTFIAKLISKIGNAKVEVVLYAAIFVGIVYIASLPIYGGGYGHGSPNVNIAQVFSNIFDPWP